MSVSQMSENVCQIIIFSIKYSSPLDEISLVNFIFFNMYIIYNNPNFTIQYENLPFTFTLAANVRDISWIPSLGRSHVPRSSLAPEP